jgi:hypothetical protein
VDVDVRALRAAAAKRREARRWQPVDERKAIAAAIVEGRDPPRVHNDWLHGPEFAAARTLSDWVDDRWCERSWPALPETAVTAAILAAIGEGQDAAVAAVRRARKLTLLQQYLVFSALMGWRATGFTAAGPVLAAIVRQWRELGLAERHPDAE